MIPLAATPPQKPPVQDSPLQQAVGFAPQEAPAGMHGTHLLPLQSPLQQSMSLPQGTSGEQEILPMHVHELQDPLLHTLPPQQSALSVQPGWPGSRQATQVFTTCVPGAAGAAWQRLLQH